MKKFMIMATMILSLMVLASCASREERVVNKLNRLAERVEDNRGKMDADELAEVIEDLQEIHEDMKDCDFTAKQMKEIGRADGKIAAALTESATAELGGKVMEFLNTAASAAIGFKEGLENGFGGTED